MGIFNLLKKQPPLSTPALSKSQAEAAPAANKPGTTRIEREHFILHAPFEWIHIPGHDPMQFEFRNQSLPDQLIVSVFLAREPFADVAARRAMAKQLADKRIDAIRQLSNGKAVLSECSPSDGSTQTEIRCVGVDEPQRVRMAFVVRVTRTKVVTVSMTRYALDEPGHQFDVYSGLIFDFLQIKE
ncbi:MAG TPA: hypothetical protein VFE58_07965 [Tepidisphaeraceae bacterium]|jgi:hypothetical protein|nr:hypothetical protein [Tepidisphaeraceae bacterium]